MQRPYRVISVISYHIISGSIGIIQDVGVWSPNPAKIRSFHSFMMVELYYQDLRKISSYTPFVGRGKPPFATTRYGGSA